MSKKTKELLRELLDILVKNGPDDPDEWCEYGGGCGEEPDSDDPEDDWHQCEGCAAYYRVGELITELRTKVGS